MEDVTLPDPPATPSTHGRFRSSSAALLVRMVGNHPNIIGILGTLIAIVVVLVPWLMMESEREQAIQHARQVANNFAAIIALELERDLRFHDAQLKSMARNAGNQVTWTLPPAVQHELLFWDLPSDAYVDGQFLVGAAGQIVASKDGDDVGPELRLSDHEHFLKQKNDPSAGLVISHPFHSRLLHGTWSIALTRRVDGPDGAFAGIALFEVRLALFQRLFDRIDINPPGLVAIMLDDGTLLATRPYANDTIGVSVAKTPVYQGIIHRRNGWTIEKGMGGVERLYVFLRTPDLPFITVVAPAMSDVLRDWRRQQRITVGLAASFGVVLAIGAWLLAYTLRAKLRAEVELERLASTDGLTRLTNRRMLDLRLEDEWQHALRNGSALSVLFVDIDRFKLYNDTYGHAAGDDVLAIVAGRIDAAARRSIDCVGRYGGEEFVVVLPETTSEGAVIVAEVVRKEIEALAIANPGSEAGVVTVSIGCATCRPSVGMTVDELVEAADKQLYKAKTSGRNQVQATVLAEEGVS